MSSMAVPTKLSIDALEVEEEGEEQWVYYWPVPTAAKLFNRVMP